MGYRWFDRESHTPRFPFGHGLSYTSFAFSDLNVRVDGVDVTVDVTVTNTGDRAGAAVPQLYVERRSEDAESEDFVARLVGFARVDLQPRGRRSIRVVVDPRLLARWDVDAQGFHIAGGDQYVLRVGADALDGTGPRARVALPTAPIAS